MKKNMRIEMFVLLAIVASAVYHFSWIFAARQILDVQRLPATLHIALLLAIPAAIMVAAAYALGVWRGANEVLRAFGIVVLAALLPLLALQGLGTIWCLMHSECF